MKITEELNVRVRLDEGRGPNNKGDRHMVYKDTLGIDTIGFGRNLAERGLSDKEVSFMLDNDLADVTEEMSGHRDFSHLMWDDGPLSQIRQEVLANMAINMGVPRLSKFKMMLQALNDCDFEKASLEMLDSKWAGQVGARSNRLSEQMRTGVRQ